MYSYKYPRPAVTADCVVFAREGGEAYVLLVERGHEPYRGAWAFPGGFMEMDETAEECATRELREETGLEAAPESLVQIGAFTAVDRDPRGRVVTVAFVCSMDGRRQVCGGDDAARAEWFPVNELPELAFDHKEIMSKALDIWRGMNE